MHLFLQVLQEEGMIDNAAALGERTRDVLSKLHPDVVLHHRGKGLLNAVIIRDTGSKLSAIKGELYPSRGFLVSKYRL